VSTIVLYVGEGAGADRIAKFLSGEVLPYSVQQFESSFRAGSRIVAVMAAGIVVRALAPLVRDKWSDPPVVVVSPDLRFAIPLLGGHHGANDLAKELEGLGMIAVFTTTTEAMGRESVEVLASRRGMDIVNRDSTRAVNVAVLRGDVPLYSIEAPAMVLADPGVSILCQAGDAYVGLGCNRGTAAEEITAAVRTAFAEAGVREEEVALYATTRKKMDEKGLLDAVDALKGNLVFVEDATLNAQDVEPSKAHLIGLKGVAEPAALAISRKKELVFRRKAYGNVTVAVAR
jgi:cobalt-precorrin 5A hydrolase